MRFRVAGQTHEGRWESLVQLGELRLRDCLAQARAAWESGRYGFVAVYNSFGRRRSWFGEPRS